jgi:hypothetical protein
MSYLILIIKKYVELLLMGASPKIRLIIARAIKQNVNPCIKVMS